jgi:hypothetical protein
MDIQNWQAAQDEINALAPALDFPTVLSDKDFQPHLTALQACHHDSGRKSVIAALVNSDVGLVLTADQVGSVLAAYHHDSGREDALDKLGPRVADPAGLLRHTHTMHHDSGRKALHKWAARPAVQTRPQKTRGLDRPSFLAGMCVGLAVGALVAVLLGT